MKTHYDVLKIANDATHSEIQKAYKNLLLETHPDKDGNGDSDKLKEIIAAYKLLKDPEKRKKYDEKLILDSIFGDIDKLRERMFELKPVLKPLVSASLVCWMGGMLTLSISKEISYPLLLSSFAISIYLCGKVLNEINSVRKESYAHNKDSFFQPASDEKPSADCLLLTYPQ